MEKATLKAQKRDTKIGGKNLLRAGIIPAVIYNHGKSESIQVLEKDTRKLFAHGISESRLIDLDVEGKIEQVFVKDYQTHPVNEMLQHLDFYRVSQDEKLRTRIAVHIEGKAEGVKNGGIMEVFLTEVPYETYPKYLSEFLTIDVSHLQIGDSLHVSDVKLPPDSKILMDPQTVICHVTHQAKEEAPVAAAAAPGAAAPAAEAAKTEGAAKAEPAKK
ncbi:MAG: 50S ribosomal protein L25 [Leptospiraceae bacterium]|nr:50S ribosomal protein L25 [Leptospiraceae bacterium]